MDGKPILTELNNGVLSSTHAMPKKNITSDNTQSFSNNRQLFQNAYQPPVNYSVKQVTKSFFQRSTGALPHGYIVDGPKSALQKKWIGGNRDASQTAMRRRMNTTGASLMISGPKSFNSINDNNPRIEALTRVRGGGSCVPPKVSKRNPVPYVITTTITDPNTYFRIISAGLSAISGYLVSWSGSTAYGQSPGFYRYTPSEQTAIANTISSTFTRSYNVLTIDRTTGATVATTFDVFGTAGQPVALTNYLNSLTNSVIVVISTYDEPRNGFPNTYLPSTLITAIQRCGGSSDFGSVSGSPPGILQYRSAYVLVGIPGVGTDNGIQRYKGIYAVAGDPTAAVDIRFSVLNGQYTYISG